ncbi:MAG: ergothioneine biosynthesis protein EgtB [Alphaproteobacteria bacterium]
MGPAHPWGKPSQTSAERGDALERFRTVRAVSEELCKPLPAEDYVVQSMPDVSPPKWHLAHETWFFETFILVQECDGYRPFHPKYAYLFNSYYEGAGPRHPRTERGLLSRPTVEEVYRYRAHVDEAMGALIEEADEAAWRRIDPLLTIGLNHEQQHQELFLYDLKHILGTNPLKPAYRDDLPVSNAEAAKLEWLDFAGGIYVVGHDGEGFAFDNERPDHRELLEDFRLGSCLVTNGAYLEFIDAGGYDAPEYWLSDGWASAKRAPWEAPLYWERVEGEWWIMTLAGFQRLNPDEPVCHVSFYEAEAYARWRGKRLPAEAEWEVAAAGVEPEGNFVESGFLHPVPAGAGNGGLRQMFGDVWEWTQSPYAPYPGFAPLAGTVGEYNGKFMCNQMVLRGGACVTPRDHIRATYRNFFYPDQRWQFAGIRLAESVG